MTRLESTLALRRYSQLLAREQLVALGRRKPLPPAAWRGLAVRLEVQARLVSAARRSEFIAAAHVCWDRWSKLCSAGKRQLVTYDRGGRVVGVRWVEVG